MKKPTNSKVLITFPDDMLSRINEICEGAGVSRSEVVRKAVEFYLKQQRARQMKAGYEAMAEINLALAQEALAADNSQFEAYEELLKRMCDSSD